MIALRVEDLSKLYRLGEFGTGSLTHDMYRWFEALRGREDPYQKMGEENNRAKAGKSSFVWALKDINFHVNQGEVLGIVGKNGAGKSTLLKILSKVTGPTTGTILGRGRIASLLEVGTGFHPELTGRENIYLNGTIMGMTKREVERKLDEIVDFAGVERYLDTPTRRYSSGMTVRLGFAVAAHLEPEILIVDEVLAVGDYSFQKKAVGKMKSVSESEGRTVIFISHNMESVRDLCNKGILLENGRLTYEGTAVSTVAKYLEKKREEIKFKESWNQDSAPGNAHVKILHYEIQNSINQSNQIQVHDPIRITINFWLAHDTDKPIDIVIQLYNQDNHLVSNIDTSISESTPNSSFKKGEHEFVIDIPHSQFNKGIYTANLNIIENQSKNPLLKLEDFFCFHVLAREDQQFVALSQVDILPKVICTKN